MPVLSRFSESSTDRLIVSGRLSSPPPVAAGEVEAELGRDHDLLANRLESFAHELFVRERAVDLCGVEERDAALDGRADQRDHLLWVGEGRETRAHTHAAEAERRDFEVASKCSLLHCASFRRGTHQSSIATLIASRSFIAR